MKDVLKVDYEEWLRNVYNAEWSGWQTLKEIMPTIGKSKAFPDPSQWIEHSICFLNNYILEKEISRLTGLKFIDEESHLALYAGLGKNSSDFIDENGTTYELKQGRSESYLNNIDDWRWHGADVRLFYARESKTLFDVTSFEELCNVIVQHFNPVCVAEYLHSHNVE